MCRHGAPNALNAAPNALNAALNAVNPALNAVNPALNAAVNVLNAAVNAALNALNDLFPPSAGLGDRLILVRSFGRAPGAGPSLMLAIRGGKPRDLARFRAVGLVYFGPVLVGFGSAFSGCVECGERCAECCVERVEWPVNPQNIKPPYRGFLYLGVPGSAQHSPRRSTQSGNRWLRSGVFPLPACFSNATRYSLRQRRKLLWNCSDEGSVNSPRPWSGRSGFDATGGDRGRSPDATKASTWVLVAVQRPGRPFDCPGMRRTA